MMHPTCLNWMLELMAQVKGVELLGFEIVQGMAGTVEHQCKIAALQCSKGGVACDQAMSVFVPFMHQFVIPMWVAPPL